MNVFDFFLIFAATISEAHLASRKVVKILLGWHGPEEHLDLENKGNAAALFMMTL